ncbi:putative LINE-1 retrotransposable element ORF2 protein [Nannochloris sp. 'desiccata']|nr:putative LINE-1 retrotransposable element ORF2 protein [Chlorella desiccata (nom. nud.)]
MREALNLEIEDDIDIIMLNEIWLHDVEELPYIPGFKLSYGAARPITARATGYGGAAIYIKQENFGKIDVWRVRESDGVIWIKCQKSERAPVQFFCCCYAAPDNTPGCPQNIDDWFEELENEISIARGLGEVLVAGDFNAHIGTEPDFDRLCAAGTDRGSGVDRLIMEEDMVHACCPRTSVDASLNSRGKKLLQLCDFTGLYVVNGRVAGDIPAAATCLTNSKSKEPTSVIDLFLACPKVFIKTESLKVGGKLAQGADHLAVTVTINEFMSMSELMEGEYEADDVELSISNSTPSFNIGDEFIIDPKLLPAFKAELQAAAPLLEQICVAANDTAESKNANMLNTAEADLRKVLSNACVAAGMKIKGAAPDKDRWARKMNKLPPALKLQQKQARSTHRRAVRECDVEAIVTNRNNVKRSHRNIRKARRSLGAKRLERLLKFDPKEFYQKYRRPPSPTLVSQSDLSNHFEQLLGAEPPDLPVPPIVPGTVPPPESIEGLLQTPFSMEEMLAALKKVRNGAAMLGILKPQLLKSAIAEIGPTLLELLNASVAVGKLPTAWALSAITAIPKAGSDTRTCDGYRGIAVGTLAAKLHGSMLDIRTSCWAEASELRAEGQFGFRRGKGTASASFILRALTDRVKAQKGGRLYTCFVDFKKAYDSVPRHLLWAKLERRGVTGWVLNAIKAMYADVPMCVKSSTGLGRTFQSKLGVKQGCPLSPLLFGLYLDDWDDELRAAAGANNSESTEFDFPTLNNMPLRSLMYADDLVQAATSMPGLRKQMALLEDFSARWGLTVNASKTKLMLFSGIRSIKEEKAAVLYVDGETVEVVEQFKYLGTIFHCSNALSRYAVPARALSGRKAYHATRRRLEELELKGVDTNFRLFDVMVEPVLGYGAEVWAPELLCQDPLKNSCERVHLQALKWLFGVRKSAASCIVLAEAGRWPLALRWVKRLTRFYNGLVKAPSNSILKNAFIDNCQLKANPLPGSIPSVAQRCWAAQLQRAFSLFGVVISLEEPCELHVNQVCRRWKQWYLSEIQNVDESRTKIYKYVHEIRNGLPEKEYCAAACLTIPGFRSRQRLLQLRMGSHWLKEETGRWTHIKREERECKQCAGKEMNTVETVEHMVFKCPNYDDIRADFSCLDFSNNNLNEFLEQQQTQLGSFVKKCEEQHRVLNPPPPRRHRRRRAS